MTHNIRPAVIGLIVSFSLATAACADDKANSVEGAWTQVEQKNGEAPEYVKTAEGTVITDCIVGGRFIMTFVQKGKVAGVLGGRYKADKDKFTEIIEYVSGDNFPDSFVGSSFEFTVKVDGEKMTKVGSIKLGGQDIKIDEKWELCKP
jgi:hypothetical protein